MARGVRTPQRARRSARHDQRGGVVVTLSFVPAQKEQAKLRLAIIGQAGSGKTWTALALATHLVPGGRIGVIDTERGRSKAYAKRFVFEILELERHSPDDYVEAIEVGEAAGFDVLVVDSLSHAWAGRDGA